jgi:DNA primase catalytic core
MSDTGDLLRNTIYPAIYARADKAFPEMELKPKGTGWTSSLMLFGKKADRQRPDRTVIQGGIFGLKQNGGDNTALGFKEYIKQKEGLGDDWPAIRDALAAAAGLSSFPGLTGEQIEYMKKAERRADLWAAITSYCQWCLQNAPSADKVKEYLAGRGYKPEHIEVMGLGFLPSQAKLFEHLKTKGFQAEELGAVTLHAGIGTTNPLIIPYRASGRVIGIAARRIDKEDGEKYLYSTGLKRREELFNLNAIRGEKDLVVVEGTLDALAASVIAGIENVVALGDSSGFNKERIAEAKARGARKITLCLDNDEAGRAGTERALKELKEHAPELPVFIALLPEGTKDPDELIRKRGPDALKEAIKGMHGWKYTLQNIINARDGEELADDKIRAELVEELERAAADITSPTERDEAYTIVIEKLAPHGITKESFQKATEAIRQREREAKQDKDALALWADGKRLIDEGKTGDALKLLSEGSRELQARSADYSGLLLTVKEKDIREAFINEPDSLKSGYTIGGDELLFPSGALSFIVGATGHGKTTLLLNALINAAATYSGKNFYLFSYEESLKKVLVKALSIYAGMELSTDNKGTLKAYYQGEEKYFKGQKAPAEFLKRKEAFYRDMIEPGRVNIQYTSATAPELVEAIRYLKGHGNAGGIFIDYMQLLKKPGQRWGARQEELKAICVDLKDMAVETELPIILSAQFNREADSPLDLRASNIGEAGDIERIANMVLGIWNGNFKPKVDKGKSDKKTRDEKDIKDLGFDENTLLKPGKLYIEILKSRDGEIGKSGFLDFDGNTGKITEPKNELEKDYGV